jgi:hypothetical protein
VSVEPIGPEDAGRAEWLDDPEAVAEADRYLTAKRENPELTAAELAETVAIYGLDAGPSEDDELDPARSADAFDWIRSLHKHDPELPVGVLADGIQLLKRPAWLLDAADLLAEPDPGETPFLVDGLIVESAIAAFVGRWKTTKSYGLLYLLMCVALAEPAWGLPTAGGPVVYVCEESGRAALWRRLDALCRGYGFDPENLRDRLHVAANARVRLDDPGWQAELVAIGREVQPTIFAFDPLARMKAAQRAENEQKEMAIVIEYLRELRDETNAAVGFVHHTGHAGEHMRGSSDLESVWETRIGWERKTDSPEVTIKSEHREADGRTLRYRIAWDHETRTMRFPLVEGDALTKVRAHLADHPDDSGNAVFAAVGGKRREVLEAVKTVREEGGTPDGYQSGTTPSGTASRGGTPDTPFRGSGTTLAESASQAGTDTGYHPSEDEVERLARKAEEWGAA